MPENLVAYKRLIISPGDVAKERATIAAVLQTWNSQIGRALACQVTPIGWETHGVPDASGPAQTILNQQIVDEADFGIADLEPLPRLIVQVPSNRSTVW